VPTDPVRITLRLNGPLKLQGAVVVRRSDGEILCRDADIALCRCGQSATKPFCDGTHKRVPFDSSRG
jgi:CDGSH-type Zn-finger protein